MNNLMKVVEDITLKSYKLRQTDCGFIFELITPKIGFYQTREMLDIIDRLKIANIDFKINENLNVIIELANL